MSPQPHRYTSRIQKGGALLEEMRQLVLLWKAAPLDQNKAEVHKEFNPLNKATRARVVDVLNRIFVPRFVEGPIREPVGSFWPHFLEKLCASPAIVRPIYFWLTALAEPLMYDFCTHYLSSRRVLGLQAINVNEAAAWIQARGCGWSEVVTIKVTGNSSRGAKRLWGPRGQSSQASYIAAAANSVTCLHHILPASVRRGGSKHAGPLGLETFFMLTPWGRRAFASRIAPAANSLQYHAAGSVVSLSFPVSTAEEYAHVVLGR